MLDGGQRSQKGGYVRNSRKAERPVIVTKSCVSRRLQGGSLWGGSREVKGSGPEPQP